MNIVELGLRLRALRLRNNMKPLPTNWETLSAWRQRYFLWRNDCGYSPWRAFWMAIR
jgi:hypothetical protein